MERTGLFWPDGRSLFRRRWPNAARVALVSALLMVATMAAVALVRLLQH